MATDNKTCIWCGVEKPLNEFHRGSASTDGHVGQCKSCMSDYQKRPEVKARKSGQQKRRMRNRKLFCIEYKGGVCAHCGEMPHRAAMEFHHINPEEKDFNIGSHFKESFLMEELDKCILLCANCHRALHAEEEE